MTATKSNAPGDPIEFVERHGSDTLTRTGVIWSAGPAPSTLWVQPDNDPANQVAVKLHRGQQPEAMPGFPASWQRDAIRRCDNVRRFGRVFGVIDSVGYGGVKTVSWHVDPTCPSAAGKTPYEQPGHTVREVVDILLGRYQFRSNTRLCLRCVYLDETAEIGTTA